MFTRRFHGATATSHSATAATGEAAARRAIAVEACIAFQRRTTATSGWTGVVIVGCCGALTEQRSLEKHLRDVDRSGQPAGVQQSLLQAQACPAASPFEADCRAGLEQHARLFPSQKELEVQHQLSVAALSTRAPRGLGCTVCVGAVACLARSERNRRLL